MASLNANGDFSFRPIQMGPLSLVKPAIRFDQNQTHLNAVSQATLDDIGRIVAHNDMLELHILSYAADDALQAKERAQTIKRYLLERYRSIATRRIKPSWFGVSEKISLENRSFALESSVHFFATVVDAS